MHEHHRDRRRSNALGRALSRRCPGTRRASAGGTPAEALLRRERCRRDRTARGLPETSNLRWLGIWRPLRMILLLLAYLGGVLTIVSPCILPVLPFVFVRADRPFVRSGLPLLIGMAATFAAVATLAAVGGGWAIEANHYGRVSAIALLAVFGITLLFPALSDRMTRPFVALGARLSQSADQRTAAGGSTILPSLLLGVATGLLWAPCAGPVLGLILTG